MPAASGKCRNEQGFTMIELMLVVLIISLVSAMAVPTYRGLIRSAERAALVADSHELYKALMRYQTDYGSFPAEATPPDRAFNPTNLSPISTGGYFTHVASFNNRLYKNSIILYLAPDVKGVDTQFLMAMRARFEPELVVIVAYTDMVSQTNGAWLDGVYTVVDDKIVPIEQGL